MRLRRGSATAGTVTEADVIARLPGGDIPFTLRRSPRATRLRLVIHPERGVVVTMPAHRSVVAPERQATAFIAEREDWVRRHLDRMEAAASRLDERPSLDDGRLVPYRGEPHRVRVVPAPRGVRSSRVSRVGGDEGDELLVERTARDARPTSAILDSWFRERARALLEDAVARHAATLGVAYTSVTIRDTTSRWGSCSRRGALSFSWRLVLAPPDVLDYVVVHELAHLRHGDHGGRFWELV